LNVRHVLRRVQEITALYEVLAVQPDAVVVHFYLHNIYWTMNYYDAALFHLREEVRCRQLEADRNPDNKEMLKALQQRQKDLDNADKAVQEVQRQYEFTVASLGAKDQALLAFRLFGLPQLALASLMRADLSKMSGEEVNMVLYLHLTLG